MAIESTGIMRRAVAAGAVVAATLLCAQFLTIQSASAGDNVTSSDEHPSVTSRDDWDRAMQLLGPAKAGDRDAQYRLFALINWCDAILDQYFTKDGVQLTLDEGLAGAANASQRRQAQEEFPHCQRFREHNVPLELGSAEYWLEKSTQNGQPRAQAETARRILYEDSVNTNIPLFSKPTAGFSVSIPSGAPPNRRAVELLRAAVKSLDPQVMEIIGSAQTELHGSRMAEDVDRYAWLYVACQRGADCSPTSHWATDCSPHCDVSTPEGVFRGWSGNDWPAVQQRAEEINAKLDAGKWDELGIGR